MTTPTEQHAIGSLHGAVLALSLAGWSGKELQAEFSRAMDAAAQFQVEAGAP